MNLFSILIRHLSEAHTHKPLLRRRRQADKRKTDEDEEEEMVLKIPFLKLQERTGDTFN